MRLLKALIASALLIFQLFLGSCGGYVQTSAPERIIVIDAGHGGEDSGAAGVNGILEKDINLSVSFFMRDELVARGYTVMLTRSEDRMLYTEEENIKGIRKICDLKNRVKIFNSYENAVVISIHMNSFSASKYYGTQIYHSENPDSKRLAENIIRSVREELQPENKRPLKSSSDIYILENTAHPSVLIECGFLSNPEECEKLSEKEYQKRLSFSIVCGIIKYMEEI